MELRVPAVHRITFPAEAIEPMGHVKIQVSGSDTSDMVPTTGDVGMGQPPGDIGTVVAAIVVVVVTIASQYSNVVVPHSASIAASLISNAR